MVKGNIHSYETFGTVDGPGIRFVVFFQGCILQCKYCHNRDTWEFNNNNEITAEELFNEIIKYKDYFDISNGGVTFSGGDPLAQPKFLIEILKILKENNIHTAIDTSAMFDINEDMKEIIDLAELFIVDIKHIDNNKCIDLCGSPNIKELEFIKYLDEINKPFWIRQVLVPGITDDENDLLKLKEFLDSLNPNNLQKVEILPYQSFGEFKWNDLNIPYPFKDIKEPTLEEINRARNLLGIKS